MCTFLPIGQAIGCTNAFGNVISRTDPQLQGGELPAEGEKKSWLVGKNKKQEKGVAADWDGDDGDRNRVD